jgi:hypothetical protein
MEIQIPKGCRFAYARISHKRIDSAEEVNAIINKSNVKPERKQAWLSPKKRKELTETIVAMAIAGKSHRQIIKTVSETDLVKDDKGLELKERGITSFVYRVIREHKLPDGKRGRPFKEE